MLRITLGESPVVFIICIVRTFWFLLGSRPQSNTSFLSIICNRSTPLHALASWGGVGFSRSQVLLENHPLDAHFANKKGVLNAVAELVKHGGKALLSAKDSACSRSALHVAALSDNDAFIEAACGQGADVDQVS